MVNDVYQQVICSKEFFEKHLIDYYPIDKEYRIDSPNFSVNHIMRYVNQESFLINSVSVSIMNKDSLLKIWVMDSFLKSLQPKENIPSLPLVRQLLMIQLLDGIL